MTTFTEAKLISHLPKRVTSIPTMSDPSRPPIAKTDTVREYMRVKVSSVSQVPLRLSVVLLQNSLMYWQYKESEKREWKQRTISRADQHGRPVVIIGQTQLHHIKDWPNRTYSDILNDLSVICQHVNIWLYKHKHCQMKS